ncbi:hypothetical protein N9N85_01225 [Schleiferiaceae bacterium]|nr:hypothetical protein [Schleiferiaceae bacterium]
MHSGLEGFSGASLTFQRIDDNTMEQTYSGLHGSDPAVYVIVSAL